MRFIKYYQTFTEAAPMPAGMPPAPAGGAMPGGLGGGMPTGSMPPPMPMGGGGMGGMPPMGGGLGGPMGGAGGGQQMPQSPPLEIKTKDVWSLLEKLLSGNQKADKDTMQSKDLQKSILRQ